MKFKFIKEVESEVTIYNEAKVKTGDVVELEGFFADKAKSNPDFEEVKSNDNRKPAKD